MKLPEVLKALQDELPHGVTWTVVVLTRKRSDGSVSEEILHYPVYDVSVDHDDTEINLLTDEDAPAPAKEHKGLTVEQLLARLRQLEDECRDYSVFSSSAYTPLDDEFEGRLDMPLVGVARNPEAEVYGFLQFPPEQWATTA